MKKTQSLNGFLTIYSYDIIRLDFNDLYMKTKNTTTFIISLIWWGLMFSTYMTFAENQAVFEISSNRIDVNESLQLSLWVTTDKNEAIIVWEIPWLEHFQVLSRGQSQSSSYSIVTINGKMQSQWSTTYEYYFILSPKEKGEYSLWGGNVKIGKLSLKTNTVKVIVSWDKIMMNQSTIYSPAPSGNIQIQVPSFWIPNINSQILPHQSDISPPAPKTTFPWKFIITISVLLLIFGFGWWWTSKVLSTPETQKSPQTFPWNDYSPSLDSLSCSDPNSLIKIEWYFHQYLKEKHGLEKSETLTLSEISQKIPENKREKIQNFTQALTKAKYSPLLSNLEQLIYLLKDIDPWKDKSLFS